MSDLASADRLRPDSAARPALDDELRQELRATLLAARELGPEFEPIAIETFLDRLMPAIEQRRGRTQPRRRTGRRMRGLVLVGLAIAAFSVFGHGAHGPHGFGPSFDARRGISHHQLAPRDGLQPPAAPQPPPAPPAPPTSPS